MMELDRRKFLKNCGLLTVAIGCGSILSGCNLAAKDKKKEVSREYPLLLSLSP